MSLEHSPARSRRRGEFPDYPGHEAPGGGLTHLTREEVAKRLRTSAVTVSRHYAAWGLRPLKIGGRLLFPMDQILRLEQRAMSGKLEE